MLFHELYGTYYHTVAEILNAAQETVLTEREIREIIKRNAFSESNLRILPALMKQEWQLLTKNFETPLRHPAAQPMTLLEKRWLNAIAADPRCKLFSLPIPTFADVPPLFTADDVYVFDRYLDGDPYEDAHYIEVFRTILQAIRTKTPLHITMLSRAEEVHSMCVMPHHLEYSERDDKFRLIAVGRSKFTIINLNRIQTCNMEPNASAFHAKQPQPKYCTLVLSLRDERKALERAMLHFAHFEKQAVRDDASHYTITLRYIAEDETELLIRVLSFGPMIEVKAPDAFRAQIRERLQRQYNLLHPQE